MVATSIYLSEVDTSIVLCLNVVVKHQLTVIELLLNKKKKWLQISNKLKKNKIMKMDVYICPFCSTATICD